MEFLVVNWSQGVTDAWNEVTSFVPKLLAFTVILVVGYFAAKTIAKVVDSVLERAGFDRAVERGGIRKALARSQYDASDVMSKLAYYAVVLFVLQLAFGIFGSNPVSDVLASVIGYLPRLFVAVVIVVVMAAVATAARELIDASIGGLSYGKTIANVSAIAILTVAAFAALDQLQIATSIVNGIFYSVLAALVGIAIVAVGGGGIRPMQKYWERSLHRIAQESGNIRQEAAGSTESTTPAIAHAAESTKPEASDEPLDIRDEPAEASAAGGKFEHEGRTPQGF